MLCLFIHCSEVKKKKGGYIFFCSSDVLRILNIETKINDAQWLKKTSTNFHGIKIKTVKGNRFGTNEGTNLFMQHADKLWNLLSQMIEAKDISKKAN